jgi:hypothetical protein
MKSRLKSCLSAGSIAENDVPVPRVSKGPYAHESTWPQVDTTPSCFFECS